MEVGQAIYIGLDLPRGSWNITIRTQEQVLHSETLPPQWAAFAKVLLRYGAERCSVVYESRVRRRPPCGYSMYLMKKTA